MALTSTLERDTLRGVPDTPAGLFGSFAAAAVVGPAAAEFAPLLEDAGDWLRWTRNRARRDARGLDREEGVTWRVEVSPGSVRVASTCPARVEAAAERALAAEWIVRDLLAAAVPLAGPSCDACGHVTCRVIRGDAPRRRGRIRSWSAKSRANMVRRLATLDYAALIAEGAPAMWTLTYPGDWLAVAPSASVAAGHVRALRKRYERRWGRPLIGVWKREFQRRGAPHYHLLAVPPAGREFDKWLARTWADIVDADSCGGPEPLWGGGADCCERHRHLAAHFNDRCVDRREGARYADPRRVGVYFAKHGSFSAKDYQNEAPSEWLDDEEQGIGRFWGVWGLAPAVAAAEVPGWAADEVRRTLRGYSRARLAGATTKRAVWRKKYRVDHSTGEVLGWRWVKRSTTVRVRPQMRNRGGFLVVNDGPTIATRLAEYVTGTSAKRSSYRASGVAPPR